MSVGDLLSKAIVVVHAQPAYPFCRSTGDPRRFPDCGTHENTTLAWLDADLRELVERTRADTGSPVASIFHDPERFWAWIHVFDAAIDEQDRRFGRTPRPVTRER